MMGQGLYVPKAPPLCEPFHVPEVFVTGIERPYVADDFARLTFWTDQAEERQIVAKLVMPPNTYRMLRRFLRLD